jgi:hypothetical protein
VNGRAVLSEKRVVKESLEGTGGDNWPVGAEVDVVASFTILLRESMVETARRRDEIAPPRLAAALDHSAGLLSLHLRIGEGS